MTNACNVKSGADVKEVARCLVIAICSTGTYECFVSYRHTTFTGG